VHAPFMAGHSRCSEPSTATGTAQRCPVRSSAAVNAAVVLEGQQAWFRQGSQGPAWHPGRPVTPTQTATQRAQPHHHTQGQTHRQAAAPLPLLTDGPGPFVIDRACGAQAHLNRATCCVVILQCCAETRLHMLPCMPHHYQQPGYASSGLWLGGRHIWW
jgi:hypothetical protein